MCVASLESLYGLTIRELEERLSRDNVRPVHARAIWRILYREFTNNPSGLPAPAKRWWEAREGVEWSLELPPIIKQIPSADQLTHKLLLSLSDAEVETVAMAYPGRHTACLSTQVGCAMGCVFCATGQMGFSRHLRASEIVSQVIQAQRLLHSLGHSGLRNLVLMGMGEPLHNYEEVMQALEIVTERGGLNIGPSRISISTVGVVPGILRMAEERRPYHLIVSLHAATDDERSQVVPVNKRWPLRELLEACRAYAAATGRRIIFSWTLIQGQNDSLDHARQLATLLKGMYAQVNLIRLNATSGFHGLTAPDSVADAFRSSIQSMGIPCTIRQHRGIDVAAGCGQLQTNKKVRN